MPYRAGRRPLEHASKASHGSIIKDPTVQAFLERCVLPKKAEEIDLTDYELFPYERVDPNPVKHVIAIDGGYTVVPVQEKFPSATIAFFQFGALFFDIKDLISLENSPFIDPDDMAALKQIQRLSFTFPVKNVSLKTEESMSSSARTAIYEFFRQDLDGDEIIETLHWLIFQTYKQPREKWILANCPLCRESRIPLKR